MKMDRNINSDGIGKYAVINMRKLHATCSDKGTFERWTPEIEAALKTLEDAGALEWGAVGEPDEFFLLKLKDRHALPALIAYAESIVSTDTEFAIEVLRMIRRAGTNSPYCKEPD